MRQGLSYTGAWGLRLLQSQNWARSACHIDLCLRFALCSDLFLLVWGVSRWKDACPTMLDKQNVERGAIAGRFYRTLRLLRISLTKTILL